MVVSVDTSQRGKGSENWDNFPFCYNVATTPVCAERRFLGGRKYLHVTFGRTEPATQHHSLRIICIHILKHTERFPFSNLRH